MAYERVLAAFPRRPLALTKPRGPLGAQILSFLGFLLFAGLGAGAAYNYLPDLINDTTIGESGVPVPGSWGGWNCTIHRHVLASCTIEVHYPAASPAAAPAATPAAGADAGKGAQPPARAQAPALQPRAAASLYREVPMMFFGTPDRNVPVTVLRDRNNPERMATSLGESYLTDRWITLGVIGGILFALAIVCLWGIFHSRRMHQARRELVASPNPTIVTLTKVQRVKGTATWTFNWNAGAQRFQRKDNLAAPATEPLVLDPTGGLALALTDARGRAMLITAGLTNVEVSDAERQAVLDAIQRDLPRPAPVPQTAAVAAR
jgi:hypothetical protein